MNPSEIPLSLSSLRLRSLVWSGRGRALIGRRDFIPDEFTSEFTHENYRNGGRLLFSGVPCGVPGDRRLLFSSSAVHARSVATERVPAPEMKPASAMKQSSMDH